MLRLRLPIGPSGPSFATDTAVMSLFVPAPELSSLESERWRRARFRVCVFAILTISALVLFAALIYNAERSARVEPRSTGASLSNDPSTSTDP